MYEILVVVLEKLCGVFKWFILYKKFCFYEKIRGNLKNFVNIIVLVIIFKGNWNFFIFFYLENGIVVLGVEVKKERVVCRCRRERFGDEV